VGSTPAPGSVGSGLPESDGVGEVGVPVGDRLGLAEPLVSGDPVGPPAPGGVVDAPDEHAVTTRTDATTTADRMKVPLCTMLPPLGTIEGRSDRAGWGA
jgi:hypothetical protein